ncbi:hypothetical protein PInf_002625 [Phytophthora infestans]|nr:hypothetical protein PInf_002625 [Phytophthora infestans]
MARVATEEASTRTQGKSADVDIGGPITKGKSGGEEAEEQSDEPIAVAEKECKERRTVAARRRQRRREVNLAAVQNILTSELRERREERAKVLRLAVRQALDVLPEAERVVRRGEPVRAPRVAVATVKKTEGRAVKKKNGRTETTEKTVKTRDTEEGIADAEWLACVQRYAEMCPKELPEEGTLVEMRAARKRAIREVKAFERARRRKRLQNRRHQRRNDGVTRRAKLLEKNQKPAKSYVYQKKGNYGNVELVAGADGRELRVAQLRAAGSGNPSCLPTALLAFTRSHTQKVRLDSCAQFSVAGVELRKYGKCITRDAPVDVVEGFGADEHECWECGDLSYQQRITVDALLVDGQGDEFLVGENWMVEKQVKMNFATRELKYRDEGGQKVIVPLTCHGVSSLPQEGTGCSAMVQLAKTVRLTTNTQSVLRVAVGAEE